MRGGRLPPERMYPAGEAGITQRFITLASGMRLRVVEAGRPDAPPVMLVHGWACPAWVFHANIPAFAEAGFRVIALELPGHGLSDKPRDENAYTADALRDAVISAMDALSLPAAGLAGHSMGAAVAARAAQLAPDRVAGLVMIAPVGFAGVPGMWLFRAATPRWLTPVLPHLATRLLVWAMIAVACRLRKPTKRDVDEFHAPTRFPEFARAMRHLLHAFDWRAEFPRLAVPRLVIVATKDHLSPWRKAARYSGDANPVVIPAAGHMILDEEPELVNSVMTDFFRAPAQYGYISRKYEQATREEIVGAKERA